MVWSEGVGSQVTIEESIRRAGGFHPWLDNIVADIVVNLWLEQESGFLLGFLS